MHVAIGKEVQNSRTKLAFQAPQLRSQNPLLIRFGQLPVDRGRGPSWAVVGRWRCSTGAPASTAARQRFGAGRRRPWGWLASPPAADLGEQPGSTCLSKSLSYAVAHAGKLK